MELDNINKTLTDLETSLRDLDSARKQVEVVSESSLSLTAATSDLIKEIKQLSNQFEKSNSFVLSQLTKSLDEFKKTTSELQKNTLLVIEDMKSDAISIIKNQEKEITKTIKHINDNNTKTQGLIDTLVKFEIPSSLENLLQKMDGQYKQNATMKKLLYVIIGLISIGIFAVLL